MPVAVVNESVSSVSVYFPGDDSDIWYRIDRGYEINETVAYSGGQTTTVDVDMNSVTTAMIEYGIIFLIFVFCFSHQYSTGEEV